MSTGDDLAIRPSAPLSPPPGSSGLLAVSPDLQVQPEGLSRREWQKKKYNRDVLHDARGV